MIRIIVEAGLLVVLLVGRGVGGEPLAEFSANYGDGGGFVGDGSGGADIGEVGGWWTWRLTPYHQPLG